MRLPCPAQEQQEWFQWLREPLENVDESIWYLDGSLLDGQWADYVAVGFAIVVVSRTRDLLAYGYGCPPQWCRTAAAAEAWALYTAVATCPLPPQMRTDCQALLTTIQNGWTEPWPLTNP